MSDSDKRLLAKIAETCGQIESTAATIRKLLNTFQDHIKGALTYQTHAKKQFRTLTKRLRGYLSLKAQTDMFQSLRKFTTTQKQHPPLHKPLIRKYYSDLRQLSKSSQNLEKQLKKQSKPWSRELKVSTKNVSAQIQDLVKHVNQTEQALLKAVKRYQTTERYSLAICEALIEGWLKVCNEEYIDVQFRDCRELAKFGYSACRAIFETDKVLTKMVDDIIEVIRESRDKMNEISKRFTHLTQ